VVEIAREHMRAACAAPENAFGEAFFTEHILVMHDCALLLAEHYGADREIVELAAFLHDIAAVRDFSSLPRHPERGAELAADLLAQHGYPAERIERVAQCIRAHSTPQDPAEVPVEVVCISHADAMAQIARPVYWLWYAFTVRKLGYEQGRQWYRERVESHWQTLDAPAKEALEAHHRLVRALLQVSESNRGQG
jgi:uncharacterized protein